MNRDRRFVTGGAELRVGESQGDETATMVFGRAIAYNRLSVSGVPYAGARERITAGAFRDSLASSQPVIADFNHSMDYLPLGSTKNGTLHLDDRADGLHFELRLNPKIQMHRDVHQLVKDGTLSELSFTFGDAEDSWSSGIDDEDRTFQLRTVKRATLYGISLVNSPAYSGVTSAQARSMAYAFAPSVRRASSAALRAKAAEIGRHIKNDAINYTAEQIGIYGCKEVRVGPNPWDVAFVPLTPEQSLVYLKHRAAQAGAEIRRQHVEYLTQELVAERANPTNVWDERERLYRPRLEVLEKELAALLEGELL